MNPNLVPALRLIAAARWHPSVRVLDACYGPQSKGLRQAVVGIIHPGFVPVKASDKIVQWGNFRAMLVEAAGIKEWTCIADMEHQFEARAAELLAVTPEKIAETLERR
jgi:hypothetical protein